MKKTYFSPLMEETNLQGLSTICDTSNGSQPGSGGAGDGNNPLFGAPRHL